MLRCSAPGPQLQGVQQQLFAVLYRARGQRQQQRVAGFQARLQFDVQGRDAQRIQLQRLALEVGLQARCLRSACHCAKCRQCARGTGNKCTGLWRVQLPLYGYCVRCGATTGMQLVAAAL